MTLRLVLFSSWICACALAESSLFSKVDQRNFPSIFQAWNPLDEKERFPLDTDEQRIAAAAKHDLLWEEPVSQLGYGVNLVLGAVWDHKHGGLATDFTAESKARALKNRAAALSLNPNMIFLLEVRWRDAPASFLPADSPFWKRKPDGSRVLGWNNADEPYFKMNPDHPDFAENIARQCKVAVDSGIYDGIMFDWDGHPPIVKAVRAALGDKGLIIANIHDRIHEAKAYGHLLNGAFMELSPPGPGYQNTGMQELGSWQSTRLALLEFEKTFRQPRINCLEVWGKREDLRRMRAVTTLALTHSDGYVLYADPNPLKTPDHLHNWYPFWDLELGKPTGRLTARDDGSYSRSFDGGLVIFNPWQNGSVRVSLGSAMIRSSDGTTNTTFELQDADGDIFLPLPTH